MTDPRTPESQTDETDIESALIDAIAQDIKHSAETALIGREARFRQLQAEYEHLGGVADELLALALHDVAITPNYFAAVTRSGFADRAGAGEKLEEVEVIVGTARKPNDEARDPHE